MKPYSWQKAIALANVEPLTKLVCYTISTHMDGLGNTVYPGYNTLAKLSGLCRSSVKTHVAKAIEAGLLEKEHQTRPNGSATSNKYHPNIPDAMVGHQMTGGGSGDNLGVGQEITPHKRPSEKTNEGNIQRPHDAAFEMFWKHYPKTRAGSKDKARIQFFKAIDRAESPHAILQGLKAYIHSEEVKKGFAKGAAAWLADDRWTSDYTVGAVQMTNRPAPRYEEARTGIKVIMPKGAH